MLSLLVFFISGKLCKTLHKIFRIVSFTLTVTIRRYIYPADKSRANEFGFQYDEMEDKQNAEPGALIDAISEDDGYAVVSSEGSNGNSNGRQIVEDREVLDSKHRLATLEVEMALNKVILATIASVCENLVIKCLYLIRPFSMALAIALRKGCLKQLEGCLRT